MAEWSQVPDDIVEVIAKQLSRDVEDFVRFGSVCKAWRSAAVNQNVCSPWLMMAKMENDLRTSENNEEGIRSCYVISSERFLNLKLPLQGRKCWGTPYVWILTMGLNLKINLFNPLSGVQISLPPQPTFLHKFHSDNRRLLCQIYIRKLALSSNPSLDRRPVIMAIYGEYCNLAFASPGDKGWTPLEGELGRRALEILYFNGHFFVISFFGSLRMCEIETSPPTVKEIAPRPDGVPKGELFYLIEMSGELYYVARMFVEVNANGEAYVYDIEDADADADADVDAVVEENDYANPAVEENEVEEVSVDHLVVEEEQQEEKKEQVREEDNDVEEEEVYVDPYLQDPEDEEYDLGGYHYQTKHFYVYKFNFMTKEWTKVNDLGDYAFFVGNNSSFSISTSDCPDIKRNSIYFTDDHCDMYSYRFCDMGVYDMAEDTVCPIAVNDDFFSRISRPFFFRPTLP